MPHPTRAGARKRWALFTGDASFEEARLYAAELWARPGSFWLVFTPLAVDAKPESMRQIIEEIRRREPAEDDRADLYAAMLVLAELDPWKHNLREEIEMPVHELDVESIMKSQTLRKVYEEGVKKGIEMVNAIGRQQLLEEILRAVLVRDLQRDLTPPEQAALSAKASTLDAQQAAEAIHTPRPSRSCPGG